MRFQKYMLTAVAVSTLGLSATPALGAADRSGAGGRVATDGTELPGEVMAALQRDLGLSAEQVRKQRGLQAKAIELDRALQASLGAAFAGSSYDANTGKLVVRVSDAGRLGEVRAAGADARLAKHGKNKLAAIAQELDDAAGKAKGTGAADRSSGGARQASVAGMTSWYVDTAANAVHVSVQKGSAKAAKAALAKYGDAVTVEESDAAPTAFANYMDGGDEINGNCSAGFNLRNAATGTGYLLTAGHCVNPDQSVWGQGGYWFGRTLESWYTSGHDDALIRNDYSGHWVQGPWVDYNPSNGGYITTRSYTDNPVGTTVCKSGKTTKWTCGSITAKDVTTSIGGRTVYGLTKSDTCGERGDSGGSTVSVAGTYAAEGVTSGGTLTNDRCNSVYGGANVTYYYPIADSLAYYGPRYGIGTW